MLKCIDTIELLDPAFKRWSLEVRHSEYRQLIEGRIRYLVNIICFTVRCNLGEMDSRGQFTPLSDDTLSAKFANNTLYWPMQVVLDCLLSTAAERILCHHALRYIRPTTENLSTYSMSRNGASRTGSVSQSDDTCKK